MGRITLVAIVCLWVIPISILVNGIVPDPYMDEIFHVPQAQQYCNGNFRSWDPMITTPPGLYFLSLVYVAVLSPVLRFVQPVSSFPGLCSTAVLRSTNGILAILCSLLLYEITLHLRPGLDDRKATLFAAVLALYPLHWFFTFLYYTDVASLTAVLAMYLACLKKKFLFSALLSTLAVFIRQTNIIWLLFVACSGIMDVTGTNRQARTKIDDFSILAGNSSQSTVTSDVSLSSSLKRRRLSRNVDAVKHTANHFREDSAPPPSGLLHEILAILSTSWDIKWQLIISFSPFVIILLAFFSFVLWNGSIVLGIIQLFHFPFSSVIFILADAFSLGLVSTCICPVVFYITILLPPLAGAKDAHAVSPHLAQVMYFSLVSALFMFPVHFRIGQAVHLFQSLWKNRLFGFFLVFLATSAAFLSVHFFSVAHPYLLADNRHYPFYLWRKVIKAHWSMKYLLIPLYVYSWISILHRLGKTKKRIWVVMYFLATAAALVPAPLIEFRYYTIPLYLLIFHSGIDDYRSWCIMGVAYIVLNALTMSIFLFRPFQWEHEPGVQRFIW